MEWMQWIYVTRNAPEKFRDFRETGSEIVQKVHGFHNELGVLKSWFLQLLSSFIILINYLLHRLCLHFIRVFSSKKEARMH